MMPEITFEVSCLRQKYIGRGERTIEREKEREREREREREMEGEGRIAWIVRECLIDRRAIDRSHRVDDRSSRFLNELRLECIIIYPRCAAKGLIPIQAPRRHI